MPFIIHNLILLPFLVIGISISVSYLLKNNKSMSIKILKVFSIINAILSTLIATFLISNPKNIITIYIKNGLGISFQQDSLSLMLLTMISILAMSILVFSINYLDGEDRQPIFLRRILITTLFAMMLVSSGNLVLLFLAWVGTSLSLNKLLLYYKNRVRAHIPVQKKFILSRLSDLFLILAFWQLYSFFGTGQLSEIQSLILGGQFNLHDIQWAAIFIAIAGCLKSAQFPFHGWLVEVMESPTPVSALLHAGILNAGPFLILRFSPLFASTQLPSLLLIIVGGFTAIYASTVLLTQSAIKTILGYSSAAHMGFTLFLCGIGAYSAALLHLIGHSFYKAYAFLGSGKAIQNIQKTGSLSQLANHLSSKTNTLLGLCLGTLIYLFVSIFLVDSLTLKHYLPIGLVIILGISLLISSGLKKDFFIKRLILVSGLSTGVCILFFLLEGLIQDLNKVTLPINSNHSPMILSIYAIFIVCYLCIIWVQSNGFHIKRNTLFHKFYVHLRNGFYANVLFDRLIGTYTILNKKGNQ